MAAANGKVDHRDGIVRIAEDALAFCVQCQFLARHHLDLELRTAGMQQLLEELDYEDHN